MAHKHHYVIDDPASGFQSSNTLWLRCDNYYYEYQCLNPYLIIPRGLYYHELLGLDHDMWLEFLSQPNCPLEVWKNKGWLAHPQGYSYPIPFITD